MLKEHAKKTRSDARYCTSFLLLSGVAERQSSELAILVGELRGENGATLVK